MSTVGLKRGTVVLKKHSPEWAKSFEEEKQRLLELAGDVVVDIQHIGSTAVPNLKAKPIIDMLMGVNSLSDVDSIKSLLEANVYEHRPNGSNELKALFVKGPEEKRTHYLHITEVGSKVWDDDLAFRDYLRSHPKVVKKYKNLKRKLAEQYADTRELYTKGKAEFIEATIKTAHLTNKLIEWAKNKIGGTAEVEKWQYGDQSGVYKLSTPNNNYFLKIGRKLEKERDNLEWLQGKQPAPQVVAFTSEEEIGALVTNAVAGENLVEKSHEWPPEKVVQELVSALRTFHNTDITECPFGESGSDKVLVHGDACLPNLMYENDRFSGYIDLGDMIVGNKEIDLSAALWSLEYNLGKGYGVMFLEQYGMENVTEEMVEDLRLKYEDNWRVWFPEDYPEETTSS